MARTPLAGQRPGAQRDADDLRAASAARCAVGVSAGPYVGACTACTSGSRSGSTSAPSVCGAPSRTLRPRQFSSDGPGSSMQAWQPAAPCARKLSGHPTHFGVRQPSGAPGKFSQPVPAGVRGPNRAIILGPAACIHTAGRHLRPPRRTVNATGEGIPGVPRRRHCRQTHSTASRHRELLRVPRKTTGDV